MNINDKELNNLYKTVNEEVIKIYQLNNISNKKINFEDYYAVFLKFFKEYPIKIIIRKNGEIKLTPKRLCIEFYESFILEHMINEGDKNE